MNWLLIVSFFLVKQMDGDQPAPGFIVDPQQEAAAAAAAAATAEAGADATTMLDGQDRAARRRSRNSVMYETLGADKLLERRGSKLEGMHVHLRTLKLKISCVLDLKALKKMTSLVLSQAPPTKLTNLPMKKRSHPSRSWQKAGRLTRITPKM